MNRLSSRKPPTVASVVRGAERAVSEGDAPPVLRDLLDHLRRQVMLSEHLAKYTRHDEVCDLTINGLVVERDDEGRPIVVRSRGIDDPEAACTCGLSALLRQVLATSVDA